MAKFKKGDKVKLVANTQESCYDVGDIGIVGEVDEEFSSCRVIVNNQNTYGNWSAFSDLELVQSVDELDKEDTYKREYLCEFVGKEEYPIAPLHGSERPTFERLWDDMETDVIDHPKHYTQGIECWDYTTSHDMSFLQGSVIKYITRYKHKNGLEDLKKAQAYINKLIETEYDQK